MPVTRRPIPPLPAVPRVRSIAPDLHRSYPTGRQEFSRAFAGKPLVLSMSAAEPFAPGLRAVLVTTINAPSPERPLEIPFTRRDERTLVCEVVPAQPGRYSFWTRFSLDDGQTWLHDPVPDGWVVVDSAHVDHLRMYTLIPNVSGTLTEWAAALPAIRDMGFNAVHLLPLTTLDASLSPYSAHDLFSVDPSYLDPASTADGLTQLETFIDAARGLGLRLCFDLVLNHVGTHSRIATRAPEWITPDVDSPDGLRRARYWSGEKWLPWDDLVLIDYEHPSQVIRTDIHAYMIQYALFWAHYASLSGPEEGGAGGGGGLVRFDNLHSSDKAFVDRLTKILREAYPNVGVLAEYFTDSATLLETIPRWNLSLVLATPWDKRFVPELREYLKYIHSVSERVRFFMPITSHDSGSPAQEFASVQATIPRYIAAALLGTGATGITQGVEWGLKEKINFIGKSAKLSPAGPVLFADFLATVNAILAEHGTFRCGGNCTFVDKNHHALIAVFRKNCSASRPISPAPAYLVICNFDIAHQHAFEADLSVLLDTTGPIACTDLLTGRSYTSPTPSLCLILPPCAAHVLLFRDPRGEGLGGVGPSV